MFLNLAFDLISVLVYNEFLESKLSFVDKSDSLFLKKFQIKKIFLLNLHSINMAS